MANNNDEGNTCLGCLFMIIIVALFIILATGQLLSGDGLDAPRHTQVIDDGVGLISHIQIPNIVKNPYPLQCIMHGHFI